ncbi:MAG: RND family transporter, partial [Desulfobacterales bacterium]|nr:RND family transporter [Desulfobacterales bacterium]
MQNQLLMGLENGVFKGRIVVIAFFIICTGILGFQASRLELDAGFEKNIPLQHEYMKTYMKHQVDFGGANRVMIAIEDTRGDIFNPEFFQVLK